jgi:alanine racemase
LATVSDIPAALGNRIYRPNRVEVDLGAITDNTRIVKGLLGPETTLFAAVKGNGYGLGLPAVAEAMLAGGADGFTLADPADAVSIRGAGIGVPILLYGGILPTPEIVDVLLRHDLWCTVTDTDLAQKYSAANSSSEPLRVFAKIDIGLERLGVYPDQGLAFIQAVTQLPGIELAGIYSHVHGNETPGYQEWQLDRFDRLLAELDRSGVTIGLRMSESSATLGSGSSATPGSRPGPGPGPGRLTNAADPGHQLYGIVPGGRSSRPAGLRPAFRSLKSRLIQVKDLERADFPAQSPVPVGDVKRIGVMPIGRADGLQHVTSGRVRVRGRLVPIVGRLSLEHARLDLTSVPGCEVGDEVEIVGSQPGDEIGAEAVAAANGLDRVGLMVAVGPSIPRVYLPSEPRSHLPSHA